jgi:DtxR family Mn-dependent transcriptional regulator
VRPETVKHYVETIFYIRFEEGRVRPSRLAEWMRVSAPTVTVTLRRLARDGWLTINENRSVELTDQGEGLAESTVRVHRLLERWLTDVLGFDWAQADEEAQSLAATISDDVAERLDVTMDHPSTCPHGNVIPGREPPYGALVALSDLVPGTEAHVRRISEVAEHDAPDLLRELDSYGLVTGTAVVVTSSDGSTVGFRVDGADRAIDTGRAGLIWVEPG